MSAGRMDSAWHAWAEDIAVWVACVQRVGVGVQERLVTS